MLLPASVAMFTEEVGVSPLGADGGAAYRARVAELIALGRAFARIEDGRVMFKAEIGAVTPHACQVQGVWVRPELRGRGFAVAGMAAVVQEALRTIAPVVSLYVNDFNAPARAVYRKVGLHRTRHPDLHPLLTGSPQGRDATGSAGGPAEGSGTALPSGPHRGLRADVQVWRCAPGQHPRAARRRRACRVSR